MLTDKQLEDIWRDQDSDSVAPSARTMKALQAVAAEASRETAALKHLIEGLQGTFGTLMNANERVGRWLSAALEDTSVCDEMKSDIRAWFDAQPKGQ